jgi:integrase/recombinase XerD
MLSWTTCHQIACMAIRHSWTAESLVAAYRRHQLRVRGLRKVTLIDYERFIHSFLRFSGGEPIDPCTFTPRMVVQFLKSFAGQLSPRSMKHVNTALRSLFRFLRCRGYCDERLERAVPSIAQWRMARLPRGLTERQLAQLLAAFDPSTPCGLRDKAIVSCLATLGIRPLEVAELRLDDIDWRNGIVELRTRKTRRGARLPLARQAGRAIAHYLRKSRPATSERRIFVKHTGPRCGQRISAVNVTQAVNRGLTQAGIDAPIKGAYVLRHTVANRLVARGAPLKEIADFLGHQSLDTTTIYAKADLPTLRDVPLPWPKA